MLEIKPFGFRINVQKVCQESFDVYDAAADLNAKYYHVINQWLYLLTFCLNLFVLL